MFCLYSGNAVKVSVITKKCNHSILDHLICDLHGKKYWSIPCHNLVFSFHKTWGILGNLITCWKDSFSSTQQVCYRKQTGANRCAGFLGPSPGRCSWHPAFISYRLALKCDCAFVKIPWLKVYYLYFSWGWSFFLTAACWYAVTKMLGRRL